MKSADLGTKTAIRKTGGLSRTYPTASGKNGGLLAFRENG
jgi:hypothetical protein